MKKVLPPKAILIPDNAEIAFDGLLFQVCIWPQKMFDPRAPFLSVFALGSISERKKERIQRNQNSKCLP